MSRKEENANQAKKHTAEMSANFKNEINECIRNSKIYDDKFSFKSGALIKNQQIVLLNSVSEKAIFYKDATDKVAVLNFADYKQPGGLFLQGSHVQEESLCHASFLYNVLYAFKDSYYAKNLNDLNRALYRNKAIYSPNVRFFNDITSKTVDVITCAAPNFNAASVRGVTAEENSEALASRIKFVLDIAQEEEVQTLILGAYGCGVFGQDAFEVAKIFKDLLLLYPFEKVIFAIPKGRHDPYRNYEKFDEVLFNED